MTEINSTKIIVIVGPTASGKSDLGIKLAKKFNGEIISADSRQVYRGMNMGTGKITKKEQRLIKHHLLDIASPDRVFTASDFKKLGQRAISEMINRKKLPFIVGGTGFYIDSLLGRIQIPEVPPNKKLRTQFDKLTVEHLFKMLKKLDPWRAENIDAKNKRRLIRALEIVLSTKKPTPMLYNLFHDRILNAVVLFLGIAVPQETLKKKIKIRLDSRLKQGMVREVEKLHKQGVSWKRLDDFGLEYRWTSRWLKSLKLKQKQSFSNSQEYESLLRDIIKYSKRQMTWFKRNKNIHWVTSSVGGQREAEKLMRKFISPLP